MSSKAQTREKDYERGIRIADRRKAIGLSQDELAHRVGIGRQALSAIENGGDFKTQTLDNLAIVLGVSVDFIMYGKNEEKSELLSEANSMEWNWTASVAELLNFSIQMPISRSKALRRRIIPMISLTWQSEMCHSVHIRSMTVSMTATIL